MTEGTSSWPPKQCDMPELPEGSDKTFLADILNVVFTRGGPSDFAAAAYSRNFIRLCDLAIREYMLAREALIEYINTPNEVMSPLFHAVGHLEQCIHAMRRAIRFARNKQGPRLPRMDVISSDVESRIRNIRNAIEHTDERIRKGRIQKGEFLMLGVKSGSIELEGKEIYYSELAKWLKQLKQLAEYMASYHEKNEREP